MSRSRIFSRSTPILGGRSCSSQKFSQPQTPYVQGNLFEAVQKCEDAPGRSEASPGQTELSPGRSEASPGSKRKPRTVRRRKPIEIGDVAPYLQIESTPLNERIIPDRHTYILIILPQGVRAAGGEYSASEAHEIAKATKGWDWAEARNLKRLEALLDGIIKRLAKGGVA